MIKILYSGQKDEDGDKRIMVILDYSLLNIMPNLRVNLFISNQVFSHVSSAWIVFKCDFLMELKQRCPIFQFLFS